MKKSTKAALIVAACLIIAAAAVGAWFASNKNQPVAFRTAAITRNQLLISIDASGTLQPEEVIDVGAQVAGQILEFGTDADGKVIDYGSTVEKGAVLARIDESLFRADIEQSQAQLQAAEAGVNYAIANLEQLKAKYAQATRDWERAKRLGPSEALAQASYDNYRSAFEMAKANVSVGEAAILQAKAQLAQANTNKWRAERNLGYCTITAPVSGVIIDRRVNIGQTVVSSFNAPSLFLIARDLSKMQLWVAVNEADIASIYPEQPVTFTVDALPGQVFHGKVAKLRLNASMSQNVVTYTVEITTDNSHGKLLPYLTANVKFQIDRRDDVLLVPNAALRWTPTIKQVAPQFRYMAENGGERSNGSPPIPPSSYPGPAAGSSSSAPEPDVANPVGSTSDVDSIWGDGFVYIPHGPQHVRPVPVKIGITDGLFTELEGEAIQDGLQVVTGIQKAAPPKRGTGETTNPFMPKLPSRPMHHRR